MEKMVHQQFIMGFQNMNNGDFEYSNITSLEALSARIKTLKSLISVSPGAIVQEKLDSLFVELTNLINPQDLESGVDLMGDATQILQTKLNEIEHIVALLLQRDRLKNFLQNIATEQLLSSVIAHSWQEPFLIPTLSLEHLRDCFESLTKPRNKGVQKIDQIMPLMSGDRAAFSIDGIEDPFEIRMLRYLEIIRPNLPDSLEKLLAHDKSGDEYFEHFTYILHLLQNGYLLFDRENKQFSLIPRGGEPNNE